jgi:hypothetical protein
VFLTLLVDGMIVEIQYCGRFIRFNKNDFFRKNGGKEKEIFIKLFTAE